MILVIDTETTGFDPESNSLVELGIVQIEGPPYKIAGHFSSLIKPNHPIGLEAMAVHHLTETDVADAPSLEKLIEDGMIYGKMVTCQAAHNSAFDSSFLPFMDKPWICTWRCAQQLWPEAPSHKNQVLRYFLPDLNSELQKSSEGRDIMKEPPHRALPDAWVTAHILLQLLAEQSVEELIELTKKPILLTTIRFGKYRGMKWAEVPKDYLRWIASKDFGADELYTASHYIRQSA